MKKVYEYDVSKPKGIADAIRTMRTDLGWTRTRLAREAGVSYGTVKLLEEGSLHVTFRRCLRVVCAMGGTVEWRDIAAEVTDA